jgi:predicted flap endonuclease-1-like 5' DNA nuclease
MSNIFLVTVCDIAAWQLLLGLLLPFILGYLLRRFINSGETDRYNSLQVKYQAAQAELEAAVAAKASSKASFATAAPAASTNSAELSALKTKVNNYESQIGSLKADLKKANDNLKQYDGVNLYVMRAKLSELEVSNAQLQNSLQSISGQQQTPETPQVSVEEIQAAADAMKAKVNALDSENAQLKRDLEKVIREKESIVRSEDNLRMYRDDVVKLSGRVGQLTVENDQLKARLAGSGASETPAVSASSDAVVPTVDVSAYESKITGLNSEVEQLKAKLTQLEAAGDKLALANTEAVDLRAKLKAAELDASSYKFKYEELLKDAPSTTPVAEAQVEAPAVEAEAPAPIVAAAVASTPDDLKVVEGIGPKIAEILNSKGITTFSQLAATPWETLKEHLKDAGPRFQMADPYSWPKQAQLLADGNMDELAKYQDYLIAGVDPERLTTAAAPDKVDDLKLIEGIGPKIEQLLNSGGIYTFAKLADTDVADLKTILEEAGPRYQMHEPTSWPQQAALARDGKMDELKELQDQLTGGR